MDIKEYISSGIVEAFVLGLASEEEVRKMNLLRQTYPELNKAIHEFESLIELQHLNNAVPPPPNLKNDILQQLEGTFEEVSTNISHIEVQDKDEVKVVPITKEKNSWWRYAAVAAFFAFLVSGAISVLLYNKYLQLDKQYTALLQENNTEKIRFNSLYADVIRMQDTNLQMVRMQGVEGKEDNLATIYWDKESGEVYLYKNKLPETAVNKQYQLWAIVDGQPVDAGVIDFECEALCKLKNIKNAQAFAITLEQQGGSAEPTLSAMVVLGAI